MTILGEEFVGYKENEINFNISLDFAVLLTGSQNYKATMVFILVGALNFSRLSPTCSR